MVVVNDGDAAEGWRDEDTISKAEERLLVVEAPASAEEEGVMISPVMKPLVGGGTDVDKCRFEEEEEEEEAGSGAFS